MATGLFAKRGKPVPARRVTCRSRSGSSEREDSGPKIGLCSGGLGGSSSAARRPGSRARRRSSSSASGDAEKPGKDAPVFRAAAAHGRKTKLSLDEDAEDVQAFRVKKSKLSRQMSARGGPAPAPLRTGLHSGGAGSRRNWRAESADNDMTVGQAETLPDEANIVSITDDADQAGVRPMDSDADSDAEVNPGSGAAARLARAQRAAARELHGNAADAGGVPGLQADYIPLVRPKPKAPTALAADVGTEQASPFEKPIDAPLQAIVAAGAREKLEETDSADAWALQQMRIGAHRRHMAASAPELDKLASGFVQPSERDAVPVAPSKRASAPTASVAGKLQSPAQAMGRLWETLQQLEGSVGERSKKGSELDDQRNLAVDQLAEIEREVKGLDERLKTVQELEELAWAVGGLLDAKAPKVTQAAETLGQMEQEFVAKRNRRRARDLAEDLVQFGRASLSTPLEDDDVEDDELAAAAERRRARRQRRQQRRASRSTVCEGWDTSSMSEEDASGELASDRGTFCAAVHKQILGDVSEGFSVASSVLRPIGVAKKRLRMEYSQAFVPMSLPEMLALHIEHSLLWWDPLEICVPSGGNHKVTHRWGPGEAVTSVQFEGFHWFEELATFTELLGDDDPDNELVPKLIQRCVFPAVLRRIRDCWDVTSGRHAERVAALLDECLLFEVDQSASAYAGLLEAALRRLEEGLAEQAPEVFVANEVIPTWYASTARSRLLWRSCKIAHNAMQLDGRLPEEQLSRFVLQNIFSTRIAPHLRAPRLHPEELALVERFVSLLPERWLERGLPPMLVPLRDALGPRAPSGPEAAETAPVAARVLHRLGCYDEAQVIMDAIPK